MGIGFVAVFALIILVVSNNIGGTNNIGGIVTVLMYAGTSDMQPSPDEESACTARTIAVKTANQADEPLTLYMPQPKTW